MSSLNLDEVIAVLQQMQHSQDEKFRILAEENSDMKVKFSELSEQFAYESNLMATTRAPAVSDYQPIPTLKDLVTSDPPTFNGTSKNLATFCHRIRTMLP